MVCSLCFQENDWVLLPFGEAPATAMLQFCQPCIESLCDELSHLHLPTREVELDGNHGPCFYCRQPRELMPDPEQEGRFLCERCHQGRLEDLRYECDRCHRTQRIPHPMYGYQANPNEFGSATWACHQGCGDYTRWKIVAEDVRRIRDIPESWENHPRLPQNP